MFSVAGLRANAKGKIVGALTAEILYSECDGLNGKDKWYVVPQGQITGAIELVIKVGELGIGETALTVIGGEASGGLEVYGKVSRNTNPNEPNFGVESGMNLYAQADIVLLNQKITGWKVQYPLTRNDTYSLRPIWP